jgi:hypothetical protein
MIDQSIAIKSNWRNERLRAQVLQKKGNKAEAMAANLARRSSARATRCNEKFVKANLQKTIAGWK